MRSVILVVALLRVLATPLVGQQVPEAEGTVSGASAGFLEWIVPMAGYGYTGDWGAGVLPNIVRVGGAVLLIGALEANDNIYDPVDCGGGCGVGIVALTAGTVWAIVGAVRAADRRNARVRSAPAIAVLPAVSGGATMTIRVPVGW